MEWAQLLTNVVTTCKKMTTLFAHSGEMADRLIAQHYFHGVLDYGVVKLSLSNMFFFKHDIHMWKRTFPCCVVTKLSFCIVLLRFIFVQIPSFSFQLWALAMKTTVVSQRELGNRSKKNAFKRCFESWLTYWCRCKYDQLFFTSAFPKSCLKVGGAAYTRVQLILGTVIQNGGCSRKWVKCDPKGFGFCTLLGMSCRKSYSFVIIDRTSKKSLSQCL